MYQKISSEVIEVIGVSMRFKSALESTDGTVVILTSSRQNSVIWGTKEITGSNTLGQKYTIGLKGAHLGSKELNVAENRLLSSR